MEIAQPADPQFDVGLLDIDGTEVLRVAFGEVVQAVLEVGVLAAGHALLAEALVEIVMELPIARHTARLDQRRQRLEILQRLPDRLRDRAYGMAELEPEVPQAVEDVVDDLEQAGAGLPALVEEQEVDVGMGIEEAPAVPADRHHGDALAGLRHLARRRQRLVENPFQDEIEDAGPGAGHLDPPRPGLVAHLDPPVLQLEEPPEDGNRLGPPEVPCLWRGRDPQRGGVRHPGTIRSAAAGCKRHPQDRLAILPAAATLSRMGRP